MCPGMTLEEAQKLVKEPPLELSEKEQKALPNHHFMQQKPQK